MIEQADLDFVSITWSVTSGYCLVHDPASASGRSVAGSYGDAVRADEDEASALGMTGVPFYAVDGNHGISGARRDEAFTQALRQVRASRAVRPLFRGDYPGGGRRERDGGAPCRHLAIGCDVVSCMRWLGREVGLNGFGTDAFRHGPDGRRRGAAHHRAVDGLGR